MDIIWTFKNFKNLTPDELYDALRLREEIFIVEQHCAYLDADGKDLHSYHLLGYTPDGNLACYARIVKPGVSYTEVSIGRVVSSSRFRGHGAGKLLISEAISRIEQVFGKVPIRIGAQAYLERFYRSFGFEIAQPEGYFEDGILHYIMLRK